MPTEPWMNDYLDPANAKYFSNPRAEMAPEDYAPTYDIDDYDPGDVCDCDDDIDPDEDE